MAANDYIRTVNITPLGTSYSWDTPPSWITITRVGTSNDWNINVAVNTGSQRNVMLTVRHNNTTTTDIIEVSQAAGIGIPTATPIVPTATPEPTLEPTLEPTATEVPPTPVPPTATPVPLNYMGLAQEYETSLEACSGITEVEVINYVGNLAIGTLINNFGGVSGNTGFFKITSHSVGGQYVGQILAVNDNSIVDNILNICNVATPVPLNYMGLAQEYETEAEACAGTATLQTISYVGNLVIGTEVSNFSGVNGNTGFFKVTSNSVEPQYIGRIIMISDNNTVDNIGSVCNDAEPSGPIGGGGCHIAGEMITMAAGETKAVENIKIGDQLLSFNVDGYNYDEESYKKWSSHIDNFSGEFTSVEVIAVIVDTYSSYYDFNDGALKITYEHPILIKDINGIVSWKIARDASIGEYMLNENNQWIPISTKSFIETEVPFSTWSFNVETEDVYFANGILVHNLEKELGKAIQ